MKGERNRTGLSRSSSVFTLIELLVVVAIVAVLVAILLPALQNARNQVRNTVCLANLSQVGTGMVAYAMDHHDQLMWQYWWTNGCMPPALKSVWSPFYPNGLGFLSELGYLGAKYPNPYREDRPKVLRCPASPGFFENPNVPNCSSYVFQTTFPNAGGIQTAGKPNTLSVCRSGWALVIESSQYMTPTYAPTHPPDYTAVLYGDAHAVQRRWIFSVSPYGVWPKYFDLEIRDYNAN